MKVFIGEIMIFIWNCLKILQLNSLDSKEIESVNHEGNQH